MASLRRTAGPLRSILPRGTRLGELELLRVYVDYDGPRLFACRNEKGRLFIAAWVDEEGGADTWHYAAISAERLARLERGDLELREALSRPERSELYRVLQGPDDTQLALVSPEEVADDLPAPGLRLQPTEISTD
jgi:hypothetical protein